ncbi:MAG: hypothetical protein Q8O84_02740 [Nanoarchaeota archaeon]|nr:hypothetical protein [Nanoarchaeota archaeon]
MKEVNIKFINDNLENEYLSLQDNDRIKKKINWVIEKIKQKPAFGQPIAKNLIPEEYKKQGVKNAFWVELSKSQRLIYSLTSEEINKITAIILEWFARHKDYERRFGYS